MALNGNETVDITGSLSTGAPSSISTRVTTAQIAALAIQHRGTVTLTGATPVTVVYSAMTRTTAIMFTMNTVGGTVGAAPIMETLTPGTGFTVEGTAGDTSIYNWIAF